MAASDMGVRKPVALASGSVRYTGASVITVISVIAAKETRASSLRHDRVVEDAHI